MAKDVASGPPAPIIAATQAYERWLHERVEVVESDLKLMHQLMRGSVVAFLRATFYRWACCGRRPVRTWPRGRG